MTENEFPIPETKVLAIASHVVHGYVGNTVATPVMQAFGCDVAALNTVQFSNHTGYRQFKGTYTTAQQITEIWKGLEDSHIDDYHMILSGYLPDASSVGALGHIAKSLKNKSTIDQEKVFWILDPVLGDNGKCYVDQDVIPVYKSLLRFADMLLPNQFEAETLSGVKITDMETLKEAISTLHDQYHIPHILVTSVDFSSGIDSTSFCAVGSTKTSDNRPRPFRIKIPLIKCTFVGTGDMLAALMLVFFRKAVCDTAGLSDTPHWCSDDKVKSTDLPLAKAAEKSLAGINDVLHATKLIYDVEMESYYQKVGGIEAAHANETSRAQHQLAKSKAAEVRLVRNIPRLKSPTVNFTAEML